LLTQPVKRDWHQPSSVLVAKAGQASQQAGLTLVATGILGVFSETWNSAGQGAADAFTGGAITAAQLVGVTKITVTITVTSNTSNQPFDIGVYDSAFNFYLSGSIPIGAGATGTFTVDLPPAVVTALITSGNNVLGGLIFAAIPPSSGTTTTFSGTVMFYK